MGYRYFALVGSGDQSCCASSASIEHALVEMGMQCRLSNTHIKLFSSADTPTFYLRDDAIIIGHLFSGSAAPVTAGEPLPMPIHHASIRKYVLENFWGEYLLLQPATAPGGDTCFMRDPSGGVGCIYSSERGFGFVTSDVSIATRLGIYTKSIDWELIGNRLCYSTEKSSRTGLSGIRELLPGCSLTLCNSHTVVNEEWWPWKFVDTYQRYTDIQEAATAVRHTVVRVVKTWAETDRNLLLELSGGLDSSIVAACLKEARAQVACCTVTTPVPGTDEQQYARQMASLLGVDLTMARLEIDDMTLDFVPPPSSVAPGIVPLQHALNELFETHGRNLGINSFFSGAGGDTVFSYLGNAAPAADALLERGFNAAVAAVRDLSTLHRCTWWKAGRLTIRKVASMPKAATKADRTFLSPDVCGSGPSRHPWISAPANAYPGDRERISDLASTQVFRDGAGRAATGWLRMPLLSQPVMEQCLRTPTWMSIAEGQNRSVARKAFADLLPMDIRSRRSKATLINYLGAAFQRKRGDIREFLLHGLLRENHLLDADAIDRCTAPALPQRDESFVRLYELCKIENWLRHQ